MKIRNTKEGSVLSGLLEQKKILQTGINSGKRQLDTSTPFSGTEKRAKTANTFRDPIADLRCR